MLVSGDLTQCLEYQERPLTISLPFESKNSRKEWSELKCCIAIPYVIAKKKKKKDIIPIFEYLTDKSLDNMIYILYFDEENEIILVLS